MAPVMPSTQNGRILGGCVGTSVKMLADLLLLFPPAATPPTPGQDIENKNSTYIT